MRRALLIFTLLLAAAVRGLYLVSIWDTPIADVPIIDSEYYHNLAASLTGGSGEEEGVFFMSPLLPAILSFLYSIFDPYPHVGLMFQALCGVLVVYLIYRIGTKLFNEWTGLVAALLAAFYRPFIYYEGVLLSATLILVLNAIVLLLLLTRKRRTLYDLSAGIILGLSALARPNILLFAAILILYFMFFPTRFGFRRAAFLLLGLAVVLTPIAYRNYRHGGHWVLVTAGAGMNFYAGNNPDAEGIYWEAPFIRSAEPEFENLDYRMEASRRAGRELDIVEASGFWMREALDFIVHHPASYLQLLLKKLFLFFHSTEIPNNLSLYAAMAFSHVLRLIPLSFGLLAPIGLAFWFLYLNRTGLAVVTLYGLSYLLTTLLFFAASEYRLPIMLVLIPLSANAVVEILQYLKEKRYKATFQIVSIALLFAVAVNLPTRFTQQLQSPRMDYFNLGSVLQKHGRHEGAASMLQRALIIDPDFIEAHRALGDSYHALGMREQAVVEFQMAGEDSEREMLLLDAEELLVKAEYRANSGDLITSLRAYEEATSIHPDPPAYAYFNMAYINLQLGDTVRALDELRLAADADPDEARVPYLLGLIHENRREWPEASRKFLEAMALSPSFHLARAHAALAHLEQGDLDQAARLIEPIARKLTSDPELTRLIEHICRRVGY